MRTMLAVLALLTMGLAAPALAIPPQTVGAQFRYWAFSDDNDLRDVLGYWKGGPLHVQLEYWDFVRGEDQFRPEIGLHLRDRRNSVYDIEWLHQGKFERFTFGTGQILGERVVGRAFVSPIVGSDSTEWVVGAGGDYYWGSYNFVAATLIRDPRNDGLWVVPMRLRLANEQNDWVQLTVAPASERTLGWAADLKKGWLRLGVERNSRYDFTTVDNVIYTIGFETRLAPGE